MCSFKLGEAGVLEVFRGLPHPSVVPAAGGLMQSTSVDAALGGGTVVDGITVGDTIAAGPEGGMAVGGVAVGGGSVEGVAVGGDLVGGDLVGGVAVGGVAVWGSSAGGVAVRREATGGGLLGGVSTSISS